MHRAINGLALEGQGQGTAAALCVSSRAFSSPIPAARVNEEIARLRHAHRNASDLDRHQIRGPPKPASRS